MPKMCVVQVPRPKGQFLCPTCENDSSLLLFYTGSLRSKNKKIK